MLTFPQAKINLGLYVVSKREDGYHNLETIFYTIPLHDTLETQPLRNSNLPYSLQVVGADLGGSADDNLVVKVFRSLQEEFHLPATDIYLDKHIPTGAGLGGGSSDAAEMMLQINKTYDLGLTPVQMEQRLSHFGADCPFFVRKTPVFAEGIGNVFSPASVSLKGYTLLLIKPATSVSTREAYANITPAPPRHDLREAISKPINEWKNIITNDFELSVFPQHPEIAAIKQTLYDMGAVYASMSGSGSAVFGLFSHAVERPEAVFHDCFVFQQLLRS